MALRAQRFTTFDRLKLMLILSALIAQCTVLERAGTAAPVSIKRSEHLSVDGAKLYLQIRGADRTAPVLLWLHGGPGGAERPLFRYFNGDLEKRFVVVYWDQRGAGRSFDPKADPHRLTIAQHLADLDTVVDHLRQSLSQNKIVLMGHSWGAALGVLYAQAYPEKVSAFIGVNPLIAPLKGQQAEYDFVCAEAFRRKDDEVLARLQEIGPPPLKGRRQVLAMEGLVQRYGGVFHKKPRRTWILVRAIFSGLVTPWEISRLIHANNVSLETMNTELLGLDLNRSVSAVDVPVLFFLGRYDQHANAKLAAAYFENLHAPVKRVQWFEKSAHNIPFEEPRLFNATVVRELQSVGIGTGHLGGMVAYRGVLEERTLRGAAIGASGSSLMPHLHFQLQTTADVDGEGLPTYFDHFQRLLGRRSLTVQRGQIDSGEIIEDVNRRNTK